MVSRVTTRRQNSWQPATMIFNQFFISVLMILVVFWPPSQFTFSWALLVLLLTPLSMVISRFIAQRSIISSRAETREFRLHNRWVRISLAEPYPVLQCSDRGLSKSYGRIPSAIFSVQLSFCLGSYPSTLLSVTILCSSAGVGSLSYHDGLTLTGGRCAFERPWQR